MADIRVTCPACNAAFDAPADRLGEKVECPECLEPVVVERAGPKTKIVLSLGPPKKGKPKPKRRRDDDDDDDYDDYDHDHDEDDDDYGSPPRRGGYGGGPSAAVPLLLGIGAVMTACFPPVSIFLAFAAIRSGHPDRFPDPASRWVAGFGRKLGRLTFGVYFVLIVVAYYAIKHR